MISRAGTGAAGFALGAALVGALWWASGDEAPVSRRPGAHPGPARDEEPWPDAPRAHAAPPRASRGAGSGTDAGPEIASGDGHEAVGAIDWRIAPQAEPPYAGRATDAHTRALAAAQAWRASHDGPVTKVTIEELLASRDGALVEVGLGLAAADGHVDVLLRCAADETLGSLRAAALDAAVRRAPEDEAVAEFVRAAARGNDPILRETAETLVASVGTDTVEQAVGRAGDGGFEAAALATLAQRAVSSQKWGAVLREPRAPRALLRRTLDLLPSDWAEQDPALADVVTSLADGHADPLVRETARRRLQDTHPRDGRGVHVVSAIYGVDTRLMDVTEEVRNRMTRGRANFHIWSDLGGDPAVGVTKTLTVTFEFAGRRYVRTAQDGGWIEFP